MLGSVCLELAFLLLILSNDVETNPGPTAIGGLCRLCGSSSNDEKDCLRLTFFLENYAEAIASCYHHGELLHEDHILNPKFICVTCAKGLREFKKLTSSKQWFKRQKCEKKFLPNFLPSSSDCNIGNCDHKQLDISVLTNIWRGLTQRAQCLFLEMIVNELRHAIMEDYATNFDKMKENGKYKAEFLQNLNLRDYFLARDKRIITIVLTVFAKKIGDMDTDISKAVLLLEMIFSVVTASIMPFRYLFRLSQK